MFADDQFMDSIVEVETTRGLIIETELIATVERSDTLQGITEFVTSGRSIQNFVSINQSDPVYNEPDGFRRYTGTLTPQGRL